MRGNLGKVFLLGFVIVMLVMVVLLNSCAPAPTDSNGNPISILSTPVPEPIGNEMIIIGQHDDVQVFKTIDNMTGVVCYVTINSREYEPSSIFCIK